MPLTDLGMVVGRESVPDPTWRSSSSPFPLPRDCKGKGKVHSRLQPTHALRYHETATQSFEVRLPGTRKRHVTEVRNRMAQVVGPAWVADMFEGDQLLFGATGLYSIAF